MRVTSDLAGKFSGSLRRGNFRDEERVGVEGEE